MITAFLNPEIDPEVVYMTLPANICTLDPTMPGNLVRLLKALYGLHQASRLWHRVIHAFLLSLGLVCSKVEPGLYVGHRIRVMIYVNNILFFYRKEDSKIAAELKQKLAEKYSLNDLGTARRFLGLDISRSQDG
jgi:hypothetical protein